MPNTIPAVHSTFVIERTYPVPPARVFEAFSNLEIKRRWFGCVEDWEVQEHTLDFRVGGRETWRGGPPEGPQHANDTVYLDIVPDERMIWSYTMAVGARRMSASLATVELRSEGPATRLVFTEQGAFLDGAADADERERGTRVLLDALGAELRRAADASGVSTAGG